jgi:hypothetical protein
MSSVGSKLCAPMLPMKRANALFGAPCNRPKCFSCLGSGVDIGLTIRIQIDCDGKNNVVGNKIGESHADIGIYLDRDIGEHFGTSSGLHSLAKVCRGLAALGMLWPNGK